MADINESLPIKTLVPGDVIVKVVDNTDPNLGLKVNADGGVNAVISATDLDVRDLSAATDSVSAHLKDEAGNAFSSSNPLHVTVIESEGVEICDFNQAANIAKDATSNHDYTVTAGKTLMLAAVYATSSARLKIEVQVESGVGTNVFATKFVGFNSVSSPNMELKLVDPIAVPAGVKVRVARTNRDSATDLYSTIIGHEV